MSASDLVVAIEQKDDEMAAAEKELEGFSRACRHSMRQPPRRRMTPRRRLENLASGS